MELQREDMLMYVGVAIFTVFILLDIWEAWKRGALWLPSNFLVAYGFILQLVGELEVQNVSISGDDQQNQVKKLMGMQLSIDSARLTLCVFVGYLLPGMATIAYGGVWTTIAVLLISLITHIATELSVANQFYKRGNVRNQNYGVWLIASGGVLLPLLFSFMMLLIWALFIGKFYRDNLSRRVAVVLSQKSNNLEMQRENFEDEILNNNLEMKWENFKDEILKSWIVARVCRPEYILTRSEFSAGVALVVTFFVVFFGIKIFWLRSLLNQRFSLFVFKSIFILVGWIVILYRWLMWVFYCGLLRESLSSHSVELKTSTSFGAFFTPFAYLVSTSTAVVRTKLKIVLLVLRYPVAIGLTVICIIAYVAETLMLHCWLMSVRVFDNKLMRTLFRVDTKLENLWSGDFDKYKEALESIRMPGESAASLGLANESSFHYLKHDMEEAYQDGGRSCKELIQVIGTHFAQNNPPVVVDELVEPLPSVKKYFPGLKEPFWSLTALSLLNIIIDVADHMDHSAVENAVKAYNQAYDFMDLVGCPDNIDITVDFFGSSNLEEFLNSVASRVGWKKINKSYKKWKGMRQAEPALRLQEALSIIEHRYEKAEHILKDAQMLEEVPSAAAQGVTWTTVATSYSDYKVCRIIQADAGSYSSVEELREQLLNSLKNVISSSVLEFPRLLLNSTRVWAAEFEEEKIRKAAIMLAKACGVIDAAKNTLEKTPEFTAIEF